MRVGDEIPNVGSIFEWDIEEILERPSIDVHFYEDYNAASRWERLLSSKRTDEHYQDIVQSLKRWGFVRPLTSQPDWRNNKEELQFGDGHHRLAAAIDLGWRSVLVEVHEFNAVALDSGTWKLENGLDSIRQVAYRSW